MVQETPGCCSKNSYSVKRTLQGYQYHGDTPKMQNLMCVFFRIAVFTLNISRNRPINSRMIPKKNNLMDPACPWMDS